VLSSFRRRIKAGGDRLVAVIPHFAIPFRFGVRGAVVNEQDTETEILDCVEVILRYDQGLRPEKPDFGVPDLTFSSPAPDINQVQKAIDTWEPRLEMTVEESVLDKRDQLIAMIRVERAKE
jgi:phage baseplate assembly protein W